MKILVTGGCGFIGSHVVDAYVEKGHDVVVVDNLSTGYRKNLNEKAKLYEVDIRDQEMANIFSKETPDVVNHHAAQISVTLSVKEPLFDADTNIKGTIGLLELARWHGVKRFIFASTGGAIYGDASIVPTTESYVPEPASPYAISKFSAEKYIRFYHAEHGLSYVIVRYSNVYGPRQIPHGEAGVVAIFTEALLAGEHPTLFHFDDEPSGMVRDYCFVKDIARANMIAAETDKTGMYNIGTGKGTHTLDLYRGIVNVLKMKGVAVPDAYNEPKTAPARPGEIRLSTIDPGKARQTLGWEARYGLTDGLSDTIDWYLKDRL